MYIVIDILELTNTKLFTAKTQILEYMGISRTTLNKAIKSNNGLIDRYMVLYREPIKTNNKGRFV